MMPPEKEVAVQNFMALVPVLHTLVPTIVETTDAPLSRAQREQVKEVLKRPEHTEILEGKIRWAVQCLDTEEIVALTQFLASAPPELRPAPFKLLFALMGARTEIEDWIHRVCEDLFGRDWLTKPPPEE